MRHFIHKYYDTLLRDFDKIIIIIISNVDIMINWVKAGIRRRQGL